MENITYFCPGCGLENCSGECGWEKDEPSPEYAFLCDECYEPIHDGEDYLDLDGEKYCADCVKSWSTWDLCNNLGNPIAVARVGG